MLCTQCKAILDIDPELLSLPDTPRQLPGGFRMERLAVDVLGVCADCQAAASVAMPETNRVQPQSLQ
jgi:Fur family peroxide stress response transcriptional regulator